jgi:signal peptidase I
VRTAQARLIPGKKHVVELLNFDDRVIALLDDKEVFRFDYDSQLVCSSEAQISLGTVGAGGVFEKIHVYRDMYYVSRGRYAVNSPIELGPDEYFAMGDNSSSSLDSRSWGTVPAQNMLGRAFVIFWPARQVGFIK